MRFSPFIALRYLKPQANFVSVITVISVLGVTLGVMILMVVIAVFTGYGSKFSEVLLGFEPHTVVDNNGLFNDFAPTYDKIKEMPEVEWVTPLVTGHVVFEFDNRRLAPIMRAIEPPTPGSPADLRLQKKIARRPAPDPAFLKEVEREAEAATPAPPPPPLQRSGEPAEPPAPPLEAGTRQVVPPNIVKTAKGWEEIRGSFTLDIDSILVGDALAESLGIEIGDVVRLYSPADANDILSRIDKAQASNDINEIKELLRGGAERSLPKELVVTGIFDSGYYEFDQNLVFTHLEVGQKLWNLDYKDAHALAITLTDGMRAREFVEKIQPLIPEFCHATTWMELHSALLNAIAMERSGMYFVLFTIMLVAGFCIMNTMITVVYQKRAEIGMLRALGASGSQISGIFLTQGAIVVAMGILTGLGLGALLIWLRNDIVGWISDTFGVQIFDPNVYGFELPAKITLGDLLMISGGSVVACLIAALVPSILAARLEPAKALRSV
ncbi:MAG: FtsX-like permease family protein [Verrucomicrobiales bacterium]